MDLKEMFDVMVMNEASDLHLIVGMPATMRVNGDLVPINSKILSDRGMIRFLDEVLSDDTRKQRFLEEKEIDFAYELRGGDRFRINAYYQKGSIAFSARRIQQNVPKLEDLNVPMVLKDLIRRPNGLVIVTGPTGCGKSTTLAAMIDLINEEQSLHVVTVEDPIEYVYAPKKCIISQREVGDDTPSFASAMRHVLRQDPDVILIGEMRDLETMRAAITAAETGHLVFSTLHTTSASQTVDRIVDVFPSNQQAQIRSQLSITLQAVVTQRLLKRTDMKGRIPATEVLIATPAVRNLIREGKTYQLYSTIEMGKEYGMHTMEQNINELLSKKMIKWDDAQTAQGKG
ncbi:MAG: type IV pili twitching motility protein PilT [Syntrophus sp. (in: bacteria)]|nr:type IV pili twitching motility protein PilT [Syntrophus sp. (in: bacteria)]